MCHLSTHSAVMHISTFQRKKIKLAAKSQKLVLVGYDQKGRAYRICNPNTKRICVGVDVIIHETLGVSDTIPSYTESHVENGTVFLHPAVTSATSISTGSKCNNPSWGLSLSFHILILMYVGYMWSVFVV